MNKQAFDALLKYIELTVNHELDVHERDKHGETSLRLGPSLQRVREAEAELEAALVDKP